MSEREKVLQKLDSLDENPKLRELRAEFADVCQKIAAHELTQLRARAADLSVELRHKEMSYRNEREKILVELRANEPESLKGIREMVERAFKAHCLTHAPEQLPGYGAAEFERWKRRGDLLCSSIKILRELWKSLTWQTELAALVDAHRDLVELAHVHIPETTNA